ncbi:hypothetical protein [Leucothrix arctica]|uniref:Uncharacterized protein n=1 Tax=Leucothrix arctica TaxID=1481894 RepID=A0A317CK28_9GAMM|nr:hypothetical protein [Leucothrix arctica]PWQ98918.1 hypothetical protein DKT75_01775 [Leucothrix arctica]
MPSSDTTNVLRLSEVSSVELKSLLEKYDLQLIISPLNEAIPGSFWGDEEAGLIHNKVYARLDTPIHSIFHESCHFICMTQARREQLHTNAGGTQDEENAVCYLQLLLCNEIGAITAEKMMGDMDTWGYNFMLGSCRAWFEQDAKDSSQWLIDHKIISNDETPTYLLRQ